MSSSADQADRLALLARAYVAGEAGATAANLRDALGSLRPGVAAGVLDADRERLVHELFSESMVEPEGARLACSEKGAADVRRELGLREGARVTWPALRDGPLLARALGLPAPDADELRRFKSAGGFRAAVLGRLRDLGAPAYPTAKEVLDAAGWKALGELLADDLADWRKRPFGSGAVVSCVLGHRLGLRRALTASQLLALLAANAAGARGADVRALRAAVLQRWRAGSAAAPAARAASLASASLEEFARAVRDASGDCPVGRFGRGLVFVGDVFDSMERRHAAGDLEEFKRRLLDAARQGLLSLVRADLVEAMDPSQVRRSEIRDLHATFHFVRI